jgi:hypothetical protein
VTRNVSAVCCGAKLKDGPSLDRCVVRPTLRHDGRHPCILDSDLLAQQGDLLVQVIVLSS